MYVLHIMKRTYKIKSQWILWCLHHSNHETSLPELFQNYFFLTILQKETLFDSKFWFAFCCCLLFFSFVGYLFFSHQSERLYNAGNLTTGSIPSRVKKQYSRVIKLFKTSYQLHFLFSWNVFWMLIKQTKICWKFKLLVLYMNIYTCSLKYCRAHLEHLVFTC